MTPRSYQLCVFVLLGAAAVPAMAQVAETEIERTQTVLTEEALAEQWRLSTDEWDVYKTLMEGPRGIWSPTLDPVTVLGIHAETDAERRRYAELLVMIEFERVGQELKFQQAYDEAAQRLFPSLMPVQTTTPMSASPLGGAKRVAFVGSIDGQRCPTCRTELARLLQAHRAPAAPVLDLFLDDAADDQVIRGWAMAQGIDPKAVIAGRITLNHAREPLSLPTDQDVVSPKRLQQIAGRWLPLEDSR
jgi:integrating conjugative element protein (TIGR03759 family)